MPSTCFPSQKGLQTSSELLFNRGRRLLSGNCKAWLSVYPYTAASAIRDFDNLDRRTALAVTSTPSRAFCSRLAVSVCNISSLGHIGSQILEPARFCPTRNIMSTCSYLFGRAGLDGKHIEVSYSTSVHNLNVARSSGIDYSYKGLDCCRRASASLKNQDPRGGNMVYRLFWSDATISGWPGWVSNPLTELMNRGFHSSYSLQSSTGAAPDASFDGNSREVELENSVISSDQKINVDSTLKLLSGSCYLPHPDKEETGGEDAHFICVEEQAIGVADGVGGWADLGVDAGQYARELMSNSVTAIQDEPKRSIDPARVLEKAYLRTKARGSSTACIIALTDQGIHAINLGDSGFLVVRGGSTVFRSPVQQHDFNFTYQLESGNGSDLPSSGQVFNFPVASGDVIIAGTDGLFDNLYDNEVTAVVVNAIRAGWGPQVAAQKVAALARQRAMDRSRQTPFSAAAQDAGYRYYGGKLDDITVVVAYITGSMP